MAYAITFELDDVEALWQSAMASAGFREPHQHGRFECHDKAVGAPADEWWSVADRLIAAPIFDEGTMMWCENAVDALLIAKVHRAAGYTAHILWDLAAADVQEAAHVVLSSRSMEW